MPRASERRTALVLSGGGAKGAFEVGVLRALAEGASPATGHRPLATRIFTGTSVGAYNAAFLAAQGETALLTAAWRLERVWREAIASRSVLGGNGIFRLRGWPTRRRGQCPRGVVAGRLLADAAFLARAVTCAGLRVLLSGHRDSRALFDVIDLSELFDLSPFRQLIGRTIELRALAAGPAALTLVATDFVNGRPRRFSKAEILGRYGLVTILASAALPALFPLVSIDGVSYIDGGASDNTPILSALLLGADTLHVVYLGPLLADLAMSRHPGTFEVLHRLGHVLVDRQSYDYLWSLARLNELIQQAAVDLVGRERVSAAIRSLEEWHRDPLLRRLEALAERLPRGGVQLHRYRPASDLGGPTKLLDMSPDFIEACIAEGYRSAAGHDCRAAGCILPAAGEPSR